MTSVTHPQNLISFNGNDTAVNLSHHSLQRHFNSTNPDDLRPIGSSEHPNYESHKKFTALDQDFHLNNKQMYIYQNPGNKKAKSWKKESFKKGVKFTSESDNLKSSQNNSPIQIVAPNSSNLNLLDNKAKDSRKSDAASEENIENLSDVDNSENDNESTCNECHGGGELVCCDGCVKAYHTDCLTPNKRPRLDSQSEWFCPECRLNQSLIRKSKCQFQNGLHIPPSVAGSPHSYTSPISITTSSKLPPSDPNYHDFINADHKSNIHHNSKNIPQFSDTSSLDKSVKSVHSLHSSFTSTHPTSTSRNESTRIDRTHSSSINTGLHPSKDEINPANHSTEVKQITKRKKKPIDEGPLEYNRINIGPNHQVPAYPTFFLNRDVGYIQSAPSGSSNIHRQSQQAELVFSAHSLDKIRNKRTMQGKESQFIKDDQELQNFVQNCAKHWRSNDGWHPFSTEFALKILHYYNYNPQLALESLQASHFQFARVCDPPMRKYENKWKPKDKRSIRLMTPFPPTVNFRGYYSRRHHNSTYMLR